MHRSIHSVGRRPAKTSLALSLSLVVALLGCDANAQPAPAPGSLSERFTASPIDSVERADAALAAAGGAKAHVEMEYKSDARDCAATFAVNACLDRARDLQRKRLADIDVVELEANRFKRRDKADRLEANRAKREADRTANTQADADLRSRNRKAFDERQAQATRDATERARPDASRARAAAPHKPGAKVPPPADRDINVTQRERNAVAHTLKLQEANEHLDEIDRRLAVKAADRKRRADEKAAKNARTAASATRATGTAAKP